MLGIKIMIGLFTLLAMKAFGEPKEDKLGLTLKQPTSETAFPAHVYGTVELRHHINTYYDKQDYRTRQDPSFHARIKLGASFRQGFIDAYTTLGVIKGPQSQQLVQRRPEFEIDLYPLAIDYVQVVQYHLVELPFSNTEFADEDSPDPESEGTAYSIGVAPSVSLPVSLARSRLSWKAGVDVWTKLYSKPQYRGHNENEIREDDHFAAAPEESTNEAGNADSQRRQDPALRYYSLYMLGVAIEPSFLNQLNFEASLFYDNRFVPNYVSEDSDEYRYKPVRSSYYRLRAKFVITERTSVINDFYHFHEGFFEAKRRDDHRRFRNIARISYQL